MTITIIAAPYSIGAGMGGIGVRLWECAQVLAEEFDVILAVSGESEYSHPGVTIMRFSEHTWKELVAAADVVWLTDLPDSRVLLEAYAAGKIIVCDNAIPVEHLEYENLRQLPDPDAAYQDVVARFKLQVLVSDHFLVRSQVERATTLSAMTLMGRLNSATLAAGRDLHHMVHDVPIGFNKMSNAHAHASVPGTPSCDFLWSGGVWPYFCAEAVPEAVRLLRDRGIKVSVAFLYPPLLRADGSQPALIERIERYDLGGLISIFTTGCPHQERDPILRSAGNLIGLARRGVENQTCHRLRLRDVWLYEKPLLVDSYGATARFVVEQGIGLAADPECPTQVADAMEQLLKPELRASMLRSLASARSQYCLDRTLRGVMDVLGDRAFAPDRKSSKRRIEIDNLLRSHDGLNERMSCILAS